MTKLRHILLGIIILLACLLSLPFSLLPSSLQYHVSIPLRDSPSYTSLSATLPHIRRPQKIVENDWTVPSILTALATSTYDTKTNSSDDVNLLIVTSGIDTGPSTRSLEVVACVVGGLLFGVTRKLGSVVACRVPKTALLPPLEDDTSKPVRPTLSLLLRDNLVLQRALNNTLRFGKDTFAPLQPHISRFHIPANLSIPPCYIVNSSLTFQPSMLQISNISTLANTNTSRMISSRPPYGLCLMTAMRMYPHLIEPFFAFHRRLGVDRFFLYDNMCEHDLKMMYEGADVEVVYWPWARSQTQSFTHFLHAARGRCEWVAFFDADEYAFVGADEHDSSHAGLLRRYIDLRWKQGYGQVVLPFVRMRNNGHLQIPPGAPPEMYTMRDLTVPFNGVGKAIVSMSCAWGLHKVHYVNGWNSVDYKRGSGCETYRNGTMDLNPTGLMDNAQLVHYTWRSWEEYRLKHLFGTASAYNKKRPKKDLGTSPPKWYMKGGENYTIFREYWRRIMQEQSLKSNRIRSILA